MFQNLFLAFGIKHKTLHFIWLKIPLSYNKPDKIAGTEVDDNVDDDDDDDDNGCDVCCKEHFAAHINIKKSDKQINFHGHELMTRFSSFWLLKMKGW